MSVTLAAVDGEVGPERKRSFFHGRPPALAHKHPEDIPGSSLITPRSKPSGFAQGNGHVFLSFVA